VGSGLPLCANGLSAQTLGRLKSCVRPKKFSVDLQSDRLGIGSCPQNASSPATVGEVAGLVGWLLGLAEAVTRSTAQLPIAAPPRGRGREVFGQSSGDRLNLSHLASPICTTTTIRILQWTTSFPSVTPVNHAFCGEASTPRSNSFRRDWTGKDAGSAPHCAAPPARIRAFRGREWTR